MGAGERRDLLKPFPLDTIPPTTDMKTTPYLTPCAAIALFTVLGCGLKAEDDVKADPAKASIKATAIATSDDKGTITIRIEKDGRTETKVIRLDGDDDPAKAGALIAEAIKEPEKKDAGSRRQADDLSRRGAG